jgi:hypothetical protein
VGSAEICSAKVDEVAPILVQKGARESPLIGADKALRATMRGGTSETLRPIVGRITVTPRMPALETTGLATMAIEGASVGRGIA